jgi:hypothetical protein
VKNTGLAGLSYTVQDSRIFIHSLQRLGGDRVLERAILKLCELDTGWLDLSLRNHAAVQDAGEILGLTDTAYLLAIYYKNPQELNA